MINYLAILRGINVGGKRKILMADLKALFEAQGYEYVSTYIQSGNVFFKTEEQDSEAISAKIEKAIFQQFGFEVPVIIRKRTEIEEVISANPFLNGNEIEHLHLTFLGTEVSTENLRSLANLDFAPDQFQVIGKHAYIYCRGKYHESKLTNTFFEKKLNVTASTRNWKTVLKLLELSV